MDAIGGGGGSISVPAYILAGLPTHAAAAIAGAGTLWIIRPAVIAVIVLPAVKLITENYL